MPKRLTLKLSPEEKAELQHVRDHHDKPHMREKATALLKIAAGQSPHAVSTIGILKPRAPDTVYNWLKRYRAEGVQGLQVRSGRGRKPAFSPPV